MRKIFSALALVAALSIMTAGSATAQGWGPSKTIINAIGSTTTNTYPSATGDDTALATSALIHVVSASTSSATVLIQGSVDGTFWYTLATITNPTSVGEMWAGPAPRKLRLNLSVHASGTISAFEATRRLTPDPIGESWKLITVSSYSFGAGTATSLTVSGLTSGRCPLLTTGGAFTDSSAATCSASLFTLPSVKVSDLTATRVPYAGAAGQIIDSAAFTFTTSGGILAATQVAGISQTTATTKLTDGAIAKTAGAVFITKGSALGSSTLATPVATTDDGLTITITSTTAYAHVVSVASGKVNGATNTTITFTSGAIGDSVTLRAYQGVWYTIGTVGTITIT